MLSSPVNSTSDNEVEFSAFLAIVANGTKDLSAAELKTLEEGSGNYHPLVATTPETLAVMTPETLAATTLETIAATESDLLAATESELLALVLPESDTKTKPETETNLLAPLQSETNLLAPLQSETDLLALLQPETEIAYVSPNDIEIAHINVPYQSNKRRRDEEPEFVCSFCGTVTLTSKGLKRHWTHMNKRLLRGGVHSSRQ